MDTKTWVKILDETFYISHGVDTQGKCMNPIILSLFSNCEGTAILAKHEGDSASNLMIVPLLEWHDQFVNWPRCVI